MQRKALEVRITLFIYDCNKGLHTDVIFSALFPFSTFIFGLLFGCAADELIKLTVYGLVSLFILFMDHMLGY